MEQRTVKVAAVPKKELKPLEILAMFCYYYPQYKFHEARKLPYKTVSLMLSTAQKQKALEYMNLMQIGSAVRGKDGGKALHKHYKRLAEK